MQQRSGGGALIPRFPAHSRDEKLRGVRFAFHFGHGWQGTFMQYEVRALTGTGTEEQGRRVGPGQAAYREEIVL
jgi:hypothetical protein